MAKRRILVTGGAGFIGSAVCRHLVQSGAYHVVNVDKLTYSGSLESLRDDRGKPGLPLLQGRHLRPARASPRSSRPRSIDAIMHLAAESHVDRSIDGAGGVRRNQRRRHISAARRGARLLAGPRPPPGRRAFRFHHISTDEVFGDLPLDRRHVHRGDALRAVLALFGVQGGERPSRPRLARTPTACRSCFPIARTITGPTISPRSSSRWSSSMRSRASRCRSTARAQNVRDWLYVEDHARALELVLTHGRVGESYNVGGAVRAQRTSQVVEDDLRHRSTAAAARASGSYRDLIEFVPDRPGHDLRYAIDPSKIERELGWRADESFESGIEKTVDWFLDNEWWWRPIRHGTYRGERLGRAR